jgi:hypothetical protein
MGVRTCLRDLQFVAVRFSFNSWSLQGVSAESSLLPGFRADFYVDLDAFRDEIPTIFHRDSNLGLLVESVAQHQIEAPTR